MPGVASTTATAARAALLLPPMLGADGGVVTVVEIRSGASLGELAEPAVALTDAELALLAFRSPARHEFDMVCLGDDGSALDGGGELR